MEMRWIIRDKDTNHKIDAVAMAVAVTFSGSGFTKNAEDETGCRHWYLVKVTL
jgi:hypothetical protein